MQRGELHRPKGCVVDVPCDHLDQNAATLDAICLPLIAQRTTLGLLYLEPRPDLPATPPDVPEPYLEILAENIGLAVGNLRLRDTLREMAMADPLTGLANRRHLEAVLTSQVSEADRLGESLGCLMLDVDHFKQFNDRFGHDAGDAVLRAVADILRHATRETGLAFRFGGEEFLLLMPELGTAVAAERAEALRERIRSLRVTHAGIDLGPITVSVGVASAPERCAFDKLVETADAALLRAKEAGRDRVVIAEARRAVPPHRDGVGDVTAAAVSFSRFDPT